MLQTSVNRIRPAGHFLRSPWLAAGVIVLAAAAAYSNSFFRPAIFDDAPTIVDNPTIRSLWTISKVLNPPGNGLTVQGRPVVNLSLAINYALGGQAVVGYHLFNLAVHVLAALALFGIVRRTLLLPGQSEHLARQSTGVALAIALLWGVHPLTTAAVTYVTQRAESLMAIFYLLTLYCVIRSATGGRQGLWQTAAVLACLLGMASKEVMVSAPLMVLLYDRVFLSRTFKECFRQRGLLYAGLAGTWLLLAWLAIGAGTRGGTAGIGGEVAWWEYALTQCQAVVTYLKLCFWPHPLIFDYGTPVITDPVKVWPQALLLALLGGGVIAAFRWQAWIGFLGVSFLAILAPSSSVVPVSTQTMAEHRMYLPLAIVVVLSVLLVRQGWERIWAAREQGRERWRQAPALAVLATAIVLGGLTFRRNMDYRSPFAIWDDTVKKCPDNARAFSNRGDAYCDLGHFAEALADYAHAILLKPDYVEAYNSRGAMYKKLGQFQKALADCTQAIALKPDYAKAYFNRGVVYQNLGEFQQALADFTQVIYLRPNFVAAYNNRGTAYRSLGQLDQALEDFTQAVALKPDFAEAYYNRGNVYLSREQFPQALADFNQAIALKPDNFEIYNNRGSAYLSLGQLQQATEDFNRAIELKADFAPAYYNRAVALYQLKQYKQAWADVARARQLGYTPPEDFVRMLGEASGRSGD